MSTRSFSANKLREKHLHCLLEKRTISRAGFQAVRHDAASAFLAEEATPAVVQRHANYARRLCASGRRRAAECRTKSLGPPRELVQVLESGFLSETTLQTAEKNLDW